MQKIITQPNEANFLDSVYVISHSKKTIMTYKTSINHFRKFIEYYYNLDEVNIFSKIKTNDLDVYKILRNFVIYLDKLNIKPKGMRGYLSGVKGYLRYQGIRINSDDYKQFVKTPKLIKTKEIPLTKEMILRILHNSPPKLQTAILVCTSSGLRIGELIHLRLSDIDFTNNPVKITVMGNSSKTRQTRETFITSEATKALKDYLVRYLNWTENGNNSRLQNIRIFGPITGKGRKPTKPGFNPESSKLSLQLSLRTHVRKIPELDLTNENGYKAIHFHAFRKYFRTTVGNVCGRDFAEALMGHGFYMDTYYQLAEDKKKQMYLDAEPYLTLSDFKIVEKNLNTLSMKYSDLESKYTELKQYVMNESIQVPTN